MGIKYKRANIDGWMRNLASANAELKPMIAKEMESIKGPIEAAMELYSDLRKNRISGDMAGDLKVELSHARMQLRMGFLGRFQDYYGYQTIDGFTHWKSGEFIEPSLALADAKLDAQELMHEAMERVRRNFLQRLRRR